MKNNLLILIFLIQAFSSGYAQKAITFSGTTSTYAWAADNAALNVASGQSMTISTWVKTSNTSNQLILAKRLNGGGIGYELWQLNGYFAVNLTHTNGSSSGLPGGSLYKINDGNWHHIALVIDNTNGYFMYVDGKLDKSKAIVNTSGVTNTDKLYFGIRSGLTMPMNGSIDEVHIYNKALSAADLLIDMNSTAANKPGGMVSGWNFEDFVAGTSTSTADVVASNTATIVGSPTSLATSQIGQTITMSGPISRAYNSADFSPATSTSTMPIQYSTSDLAVATIVNGQIHITGKGSCTITASQPASLFFTAATPVTQTLNVTNTAITFNLPFTNHAVIQRDQPVTVSGTADPNDVLSLNLDGEVKTANVDATGKWTCTFSAKVAKSTAFTLSAEGLNSQASSLTDLLCGDVWVASGQSNMLMPIGPGYSLSGIDNYSTVIAAANYPNIRFIQPVDLWQQASTPQTALLTASNGWTVCSPSTAGGYSATAYFFAKQVHLDQNIPVGIIQNAVGGTRVEAWTPLAALQTIPEYASWYTKATTTTMETGQTYNRKNFPTANYNGMLAPYTHNPVKGIIWYQGEENLGMDGLPATVEYGNKFKATIKAWRAAWGINDLPVIFTELANFQYSNNYSILGGSREALPRFIAQQRKGTQLPNVYGITISDVSNYTNIHPTNKDAVGTRMGNTALGYVYGKNIVPNAATFKEMRSDGTALRVTFNNNSGFHLSAGTAINEFKIAGADKVYKTATATFSGNDVLVSEATIAQPLYVKFAWDENSNPNLFNGSNSPTSRFVDSLLVNTINFSAITDTLNVGDADISLAATATSGLAVSFSTSNANVATIVGGKLHVVGAGTVDVIANETGNTVYAAASPVKQTITVGASNGLNKLTQTTLYVSCQNDGSVLVGGIEAGDKIALYNAEGKAINKTTAITTIAKLNLAGNKGPFLLSISGNGKNSAIKFVTK